MGCEGSKKLIRHLCCCCINQTGSQLGQFAAHTGLGRVIEDCSVAAIGQGDLCAAFAEPCNAALALAGYSEVSWPHAALMAVTGSCGSLSGSVLARRMPPKAVRRIVAGRRRFSNNSRCNTGLLSRAEPIV